MADETKNIKRKKRFEDDSPNLLTSSLFSAPETPATPRGRNAKDLAKKKKRTPISQEIGSPILFFLDSPITSQELDEKLNKRRAIKLEEVPNLLTSTLSFIIVPRFHVIPPSTKKAKTPEVDETFNLLGTTLTALEGTPFFTSLDEEPKKRKLSYSEEFSNYSLLTQPTVVPRHHVVPPSTKRKKNLFQEDSPNLLTNLLAPVESVPRQIVQQFTKRKTVKDSFEFSNLVLLETPVQTDPFTLNPQEESTKREKNNFLDTIPNLNTSTFTSPTATPRQRGLKDLARKSKKFPQLDIIPNLLTSTLFAAPEAPPFTITDTDRAKRKKNRFEDLIPNLLTSTLSTSYQVRTTLIFYPKKRKKQNLVEEVPNLLLTTLSAPVENPIFGRLEAETRRRQKPAEDVIPNNLGFLSVESVPRQIVQQFLKRQKVKLEEIVPNLLTSTLGVPPENPRAVVEELIRLKKKKAVQDPEILNRALFTEPINPRATNEDWKLIKRAKAKLELEFRNNSILLPPPPDPSISVEDYFSNVSLDTRKKKAAYSLLDDSKNLTIIPFDHFATLDNYLRRYLNDKLTSGDYGPAQSLNDEVSQDKHLSNYIRRYLNDKTTEQ